MSARTLSRIGLAFIPLTLVGLLLLYTQASESRAQVAFVPADEAPSPTPEPSATLTVNANVQTNTQGNTSANANIPRPSPENINAIAHVNSNGVSVNTNTANNNSGEVRPIPRTLPRVPTREEYEREKPRFDAEALRRGARLGQGREDGLIWTMTEAAFSDDDDIPHQNLVIEVKDSVVILTGTVKDAAQKLKAEEVARRIKGVRRVENRIRIEGEPLKEATPRPVKRGDPRVRRPALDFGSPERPVRFVPISTAYAQNHQQPERERIEGEWPKTMDVADATQVVRLSIVREAAGAGGTPSAPSATVRGREVTIIAPVVVGKPGVPLKDAFGSQYEATATATLTAPSLNPQTSDTGYKSLDAPRVTWQWHIAPKTAGAQDASLTLKVKWRHKRSGKEREFEVINQSIRFEVRSPWISDERLKLATGICGLVMVVLQIPAAAGKLMGGKKKQEDET